MKHSKDVDRYIAAAPPLQRTIYSLVRKIIWESIPDVEESIKYTVPFYTRKGLLCYLSPLDDGMYIGFAKGYLMSDSAGIFSGLDRKQIRHIVIKKKSDIKKKVLKEYFLEAMVLNEIKSEKFL